MELSDSLIQITKVEQEILEDEIVIYHPEHDEVVNLNGTGAFVWSLCDGSVTLKEIANQIAEEHDNIPIERIQNDVLNFAKQMHEKGLLVNK